MAKKKDFFKAICEVSQAFGTTLSREKLLDLIVSNAVDSMEAKAACLFMEDRKNDIFVPVAQKGLSETYLHAKPIQAKKTVAAVLKGGHLYIEDCTTDSRVENHADKKAEGLASILDVPVMVKGRVVGLLALYTSDIRKFTKKEIEFLSALADQGGLAIQNARLVERLNKNALLFLDLASDINSSLDIRKILSNLTVDICNALGLKGAAIRLLEKESGELKLAASCGLSEAFLNKGPVISTKSAVQALKGEMVVIPDVATDKRVQYKDAMRQEGIRSMIVTPIKSRDEIIGTLRLYSDVPREFPEDVLIMIKALAHQGALAIENASMYLRLQADKESLEQDIWSHRTWF
jgi:GAF domain-containing protein